MKITNKNYRGFIDTGLINIISVDMITQAMDNIKGNNMAMGRALLITLYYTGARPAEVLELKTGDLIQEGNYLVIKLIGKKRGLTRSLYFNFKLRHIKELHKYTQSLMPNMYLFWSFKNHYKGVYKLKSGNIATREETTSKLRYYFKKWFKDVIEGGISPYYLRHNRFSQLSMAGVNMSDLRLFKGARRLDSVLYYTHLSSTGAKNISRRIK